MPKFTVKRGRRYRAVIKLAGLKRLASNETIANVLQSAGFSDVRVKGSGATRYAEALWPKDDATAEIPPEVVKVEEIQAPIAVGTRILRARPRRRATRPPSPRKPKAASGKKRAAKRRA